MKYYSSVTKSNTLGTPAAHRSQSYLGVSVGVKGVVYFVPSATSYDILGMPAIS